MNPAVTASISIVAYLALFATVAVLFLGVNLLVGRFLRPDNPSDEKMAVYECGEPTIGSSFVQFDLRFYVVALLFIVFDVEIAFFFPWATVFGKANHLADERMAVVATDASGAIELTDQAAMLYREMGVENPVVPTRVPPSLAGTVNERGTPAEQATAVIRGGARQFAWLTIVDIAVFFGVLMVGFGYVWRRGDLDWVRAVDRDRARASADPSDGGASRQPTLSA